ncbi:hypothetical protein D3C72_1657270 [compost metagenome]
MGQALCKLWGRAVRLVAGPRLRFALADQAVHALFAKQLLDGADQLHRELRMGIGEVALACGRQRPQLAGPAGTGGLLHVGLHQRLLSEPVDLLARRLGCHLQGAGQLGGAGWRLLFERLQHAHGGGVFGGGGMGLHLFMQVITCFIDDGG